MNIYKSFLIWFMLFYVIFCMALPISHARECKSINIVITDGDGNKLGNEEGLIIVKTHHILLSEHLFKTWFSHPDNEIKINPSFERLKEIYFAGLLPENRILVKVEDPSFWKTQSFLQKTNTFSKCVEIGADIRLDQNSFLKELAEKWEKRNNINGDIEKIVKRYLFFAESEIEKGEYKSAMEDLQKIIQIWPEHYEAWRKLAILYSKIDDLEKAKEALTMALRSNPFQKDLYVNYGTMMLYRQNFNSALNALKKAYFLYPYDPRVVYHYGIVSFLHGDIDLARSLEKKLSKLDKILSQNLSHFLQ